MTRSREVVSVSGQDMGWARHEVQAVGPWNTMVGRPARNCVHAAWDHAALLATCYGMLQAQASMCGWLLGAPLHAGATCPDQIAPKAGTQLQTYLAAGTAAAGAQQSFRACMQ